MAIMDRSSPMLQSDCTKCHGLCCTLLYCFHQDGFPEDKLPGIHCRYLLKNHQCSIHKELHQRSLHGCLRYDCIGAGPHILELTQDPTQLQTLYPKMLQLHQILLYLLEAKPYLEESDSIIQALLQEGNQATVSYEQFASFPIEAYRTRANQHLKKAIKQITTHTRQSKIRTSRSHHNEHMGKDYSMAFLVRKDFSNQCLDDTCFLGSDVRDMNIKGSDLSHSHFLTQMQINSMLGDEETILPPTFYYPTHWEKKGTTL